MNWFVVLFVLLIFPFQDSGIHRYVIVRQNLTWQEASAYAVAHGGYLAEINSAAEQKYIWKLVRDAELNPDETVAPDGGGAGYLWLGGTDEENEGWWLWDGDNDGKGIPFWEGGVDGHPLNNAYVHWGREPDNYGGNQNALGLALTEWPRGSGRLGKAGQWNDISTDNRLYFIVEVER